MRKFVLRSVFCLLIVIVVANGLAFFAIIALRNGQFFKPSFLVNAFEPGSTFKLAVFGSSRSLSSLDTKLIGDQIGGLSVNLSMDYSALPSTKLMLEHFYAQGYKADFVVLSLDLPDRDTSKTTISENDYRFLPFSNEPYVKEYYQNYEKGKLRPLSNSNYFPLLAIAYNNMELVGPALISAFSPEYNYQFDELGNFKYPDELGISETPEPRLFETELSNPILKQIDELIKSNSGQLIIYIAPYLRDNVTLLESCPYRVINHSRLIDKPHYFSDYIHLVQAGNRIATQSFIEDFKRLN